MDHGKHSRRRRGRPQSDSVDRALIEAAFAEFEEHGYHGMSMGSIAARASVSKVSLYRRWRSKQAVASELFRLMSQQSVPVDHGSLEADVRSLLEEYIGEDDSVSAAKIIMRTLGEISGDPELLALYREHLLEPRLTQIRALLMRARLRGELRHGIPTDLAGAIIGGPLLLYYLVRLADARVQVPRNLAEAFAKAVLGGIARSPE